MELMEELLSIDNKEVLTKIKSYIEKVKKQEKQMTSSPCSYTVEEAKRLLQEASERTQKGESISHTEAIKQMSEWI